MLNKKSNPISFLNNYLDRNPYCEISWYNLGKQYFLLKKYEKALSSFDYAIISDENFTSPYIEKAKILQRLDKYEEAILIYKRVLSINKTSSYAILKILQ